MKVKKFYLFIYLFILLVERNSLGTDRLFVHNHHQLYPSLRGLYRDRSSAPSQEEEEKEKRAELNPKSSQGVRGVVSCDAGMAVILRQGGKVCSPLPDFHTIQKTGGIW